VRTILKGLFSVNQKVLLFLHFYCFFFSILPQ